MPQTNLTSRIRSRYPEPRSFGKHGGAGIVLPSTSVPLPRIILGFHSLPGWPRSAPTGSFGSLTYVPQNPSFLLFHVMQRIRRRLIDHAIGYGLQAASSGASAAYKFIRGAPRPRRPILATQPFRKRYSRYTRGGASLSRRQFVPPNYVDQAINVQASTTTTETLLNGLTKGEAYNQRHGREIAMGSLEFNLQMSPTDTTGTEQNHRFWIVYDRYPQGTAPAFIDVFKLAHTSTLLNEDNRWRFKILFDSGTHTFSDRTAGSSNNYLHTVRRVINLKGLITRYGNSDHGDIQDINFGALYLMNVGSHAAGVTAGTLYGNMRFRFVP